MESFRIPFLCFSSHVVVEGEVDLVPQGVAKLQVITRVQNDIDFASAPPAYLILPQGEVGEFATFHGAVARTFTNIIITFAERGVRTFHVKPPGNMFIAQYKPRNDLPKGEGILMWYDTTDGYHVALFSHVRDGVEILDSLDWLPDRTRDDLRREIRLEWNIHSVGSRPPVHYDGTVAEVLCLSYLYPQLEDLRRARQH